MQQTISREERKVQDQQPANTEPSGGEFSVRGLSKESHSHRVAPASGGFLGVTYEQFLQMPVAVVLTALWAVGTALLGSGVLVLYTLGTFLTSVVAGV